MPGRRPRAAWGRRSASRTPGWRPLFPPGRARSSRATKAARRDASSCTATSTTASCCRREAGKRLGRLHDFLLEGLLPRLRGGAVLRARLRSEGRARGGDLRGVADRQGDPGLPDPAARRGALPDPLFHLRAQPEGGHRQVPAGGGHHPAGAPPGAGHPERPELRPQRPRLAPALLGGGRATAGARPGGIPDLGEPPLPPPAHRGQPADQRGAGPAPGGRGDRAGPRRPGR